MSGLLSSVLVRTHACLKTQCSGKFYMSLQVQAGNLILSPSFLSACQCNGHSTCVNGSVCEQCRNLTTGPHCETCMPGYHGDPTNGGKCQGQ